MTDRRPPILTEDGLHQGLNTRHVRMIAIAGAIGTGLFLGAGRGLHNAGPALVLVYAVSGSAMISATLRVPKRCDAPPVSRRARRSPSG